MDQVYSKYSVSEPAAATCRTTAASLQKMLFLLGERPRGALITCRCDAVGSELFLDPRACIDVSNPREVGSALNRLDSLRNNHHVVGWFSYELAASLEQCLYRRNDYQGPLMEFGVYREPVSPSEDTPQFPDCGFRISEVAADTEERIYIQCVKEILEAIRSGEVYQVNYTLRLRFLFEGDPRALFLSLLRSQPVENAQIQRNEDQWILSLSPELFFRAKGQDIEVRPMKGTLERGRTNLEDETHRHRLHSSRKDRAENLMIVDLMRNDLGRISHFGSVNVARLFEVQKLPTLFQMTSTVRSRLRDEVTITELLKALFPSGSVTGTPKISAMNYINRLETSPRGIYCGGLGHFSPEESFLSVPIRTLTLTRRGKERNPNPEGIYLGELGIGSGIVADSDPAKEWEEAKLKSTFLFSSPPSFSLIESIRFENGWHRLSLHLARLSASAEYFGFAYAETDVICALQACTASLGEGTFKVRLTLDREGGARAKAERVPPIQEPVRVALAGEETDRRDPFLFHKTTNRRLYLDAQQKARDLGLWDLLFSNRDVEITEGSICNVFVQIDGKWRTPPQECGLLAGVMRAELIEKLEVEETPLRRGDLEASEQLLVTNSIRGALKAEIVDLPHAKMQES